MKMQKNKKLVQAAAVGLSVCVLAGGGLFVWNMYGKNAEENEKQIVSDEVAEIESLNSRDKIYLYINITGELWNRSRKTPVVILLHYFSHLIIYFLFLLSASVFYKKQRISSILRIVHLSPLFQFLCPAVKFL